MKRMGGSILPIRFGTLARSQRVYWPDGCSPATVWLVETGTRDSLVPRTENRYVSPFRRKTRRDFPLCPVWIGSA